METKLIVRILLVFLLLFEGGCFVFIPGSVIDAVSDGITGDEGEHCVAAHAKVGDVVSLPGNGRGTIVSLSGKSMRCKDSSTPIRAELSFGTSVMPKQQIDYSQSGGPAPTDNTVIPGGDKEFEFLHTQEEISPNEDEDAATEPAVTIMSKKQRLVELKQLFDEGLISESEYQKARESILDIEPKENTAGLGTVTDKEPVQKIGNSSAPEQNRSCEINGTKYRLSKTTCESSGGYFIESTE